MTVHMFAKVLNVCCRTTLTLSGITNMSATTSVVAKITVQSGLNCGSISTLVDTIWRLTQDTACTGRPKSRSTSNAYQV